MSPHVDMPSTVKAIARQLDHTDIGTPLPPLGYQHSAVLALLINTEDTPQPDLHQLKLLFTQRPKTLRKHPNQICLPGGKLEPTDASLMEAALREASEEVGLERHQANILGRLTSQYTPTQYIITPYVAYIDTPWSPTLLDTDEVSQIIMPTLATLMDPKIHSISNEMEFHQIRYQNRQFDLSESDTPLWGATARIIWDLLERCKKDQDISPILT